MRSLARLLLGLVAVAQLEVGAWGEFAPRSFYNSFPGFGRHWVAPIGPYNEHLLRDYASAEIGMAVLLACAAIWFTRQVVLIAGAAFLAGTLPHFVYHLTTTEHFSTANNLGSLGGFVIEVLLVVLAMAIVQRADRRV